LGSEPPTASTDFSTTGSWSPNGAVVAGDTAVFDTTGSACPQSRRRSQPGGHSFNSGTVARTISAQTFSFSATGTIITDNALTDQTINANRINTFIYTISTGTSTILNNGTGFVDRGIIGRRPPPSSL